MFSFLCFMVQVSKAVPTKKQIEQLKQCINARGSRKVDCIEWEFILNNAKRAWWQKKLPPGVITARCRQFFTGALEIRLRIATADAQKTICIFDKAGDGTVLQLFDRPDRFGPEMLVLPHSESTRIDLQTRYGDAVSLVLSDVPLAANVVALKKRHAA